MDWRLVPENNLSNHGARDSQKIARERKLWGGIIAPIKYCPFGVVYEGLGGISDWSGS